MGWGVFLAGCEVRGVAEGVFMFDDEVTINPSGGRDHVVADIGVLNSAIAGKTLRLTPYLSASKTLVWQCGLAASPAGARALVTSAPNAAVHVKVTEAPGGWPIQAVFAWVGGRAHHRQHLL